MDGIRGGSENSYNYNNKIGNEIAIDMSMKNRVDGNNASGIKKKDLKGVKQCQTCKNRRYQDASDDPGVSFKSPTKLSPEAAASAVYGHEREHYSREAAKANSEGREVVSNNIQIFTDICPECGKAYVSGGKTTTVTKKKLTKNNFGNDIGNLIDFEG